VTCAQLVAVPVEGLARISFTPELPGEVCRLAEGVELEAGRTYLVETPEGQRLGLGTTYETPLLRPCEEHVVGTVLRPATEEEIHRGVELEQVGAESLAYCREWARRAGLDMRPVAAIVPLDRNHLLITFSAEQRVDFRELLRDLGRRTRRRVELRQIGVRDQAKAQGGWGPCGRTLCCSTFISRFNSVTIRMAKAQNLSLNPARISGMCGRLMCCLSYEMPAAGGKGRGKSA
jgi:cell fate regulator YaaT (PSP1 superfamily)